MPQTTSDTYTYQPLNPLKKQVRILRLAPGIFGQPLRGSLITIGLDKLRRRRWQQELEWHALSYVWGAPNRHEFIQITRKNVNITKTLYHALQYLRCQRDEKHLWIDQICINQDDIEERGSQVQLMRDVYSGATSVLAWLGEDKPDTDALLCMISQKADIILQSNDVFAARMAAIQRIKAKLGKIDCNMPAEKRTLMTSHMDPANVVQTLKAKLEEIEYNMPLEDRTRWKIHMDVANVMQELQFLELSLRPNDFGFRAMWLKASDETPQQVIITLCERFAEIFRNDWFSRVWTLQEAVLAKHLVLLSGWSRATLEEVESAFYNFQTSIDVSVQVGQSECIGIIRLRSWHKQLQDRSRQETSASEKFGVSGTFERTLINRKASNPRDYVYGQLGLFNIAVMDRIKPDYSLSTEKVFIAGTVAILNFDEKLIVLRPCCAHRKDGYHSLPSWCPEWSGGSFGCGIRTESPDEGVFTAATEYGSHFKYESNGSALSIRGLVIDEIQKSISGSQIQERLARKKLNISEVWQSVLTAFSSPNVPPYNDIPAQVLCRTLFFDVFEGQRLDEAKIPEALACLQDPGINVNEHWSMDIAKDTAREIAFGIYPSVRIVLTRNVRQLLEAGCIFETKERRFGQSCHHVRPGDKICLLYGGRLPFILREAGTSRVVNENGEKVQKQCYQMIGGESYVHGLVDGEGLEIARQKNLPVEDFCLI